MLRRCPAPSTLLVAALTFGLGSYPMSRQADGLSGNGRLHFDRDHRPCPAVWASTGNTQRHPEQHAYERLVDGDPPQLRVGWPLATMSLGRASPPERRSARSRQAPRSP